MNDQCKNCTLRGDYETCIKTECFHHENWINEVRINKIEDLERQLAEAREENNKLKKWMIETHSDMTSYNGYEECPYCMGELFDDISINKLKEKG